MLGPTRGVTRCLRLPNSTSWKHFLNLSPFTENSDTIFLSKGMHPQYLGKRPTDEFAIVKNDIAMNNHVRQITEAMHLQLVV